MPVALYYRDISKVIEITKAQSTHTHHDQKASDACVLYNKLAYLYLNEESKIPSIRRILDEYPQYKQVFNISKENLNPSGYVVDTLLCSLWCFIDTATFEDAVCEAVNLGGDTDTIGAITGGLAGVYYGYNAIPDRWKDKILLKDKLYNISKRYAQIDS